MTRLAVLASHGGSILQAIIDACADRRLNAQVALVISNNSQSLALQRARNANIATAHLSSATHPDTSARDAQMLRRLRSANVEWLVLAGYMKKLGGATLAHYSGRIVNTHPALLPKYGGVGYYGQKVHAAVLASGDQVTGATVHLVDGEYDTGPILAQVQVPVLPGDDVVALEERVKVAERELIVNTLATLIKS